MSLKTAYLVAYNVAQALGWAAVLWLTTLSIINNENEQRVYEAAGFLVCEVFHFSCCTRMPIAIYTPLQRPRLGL